ncbi:MAG: hypothetical protein DGJ47_001012 [Rickettsiaceae bacterium]
MIKRFSDKILLSSEEKKALKFIKELETIIESPISPYGYGRLMVILQQDLPKDKLIKHIDLILDNSFDDKQYDVIELLLNKYKDLIKPSNLDSIFFSSCMDKKYDIIEFLLNEYEDLRQNSLNYINVADIKLVSLFFKYEVNPNLQVDHFSAGKIEKYSALYKFIFYCYKQKHQLKIVDLLLENKANPNFQDPKYGTNCLEYCAYNNEVQLTKLLLKYKANVNIQNESGYAPIHKASDRGHLSIVKLLIEYKADLNIKTLTGLSPLYSANIQNIGVMRLLLKNKALINEQSINGNTPIFQLGLYCHNPDMIELFIKNSANINHQNQNGDTAIHHFLGGQLNSNRAKIVKLLLEDNADINILNDKKITPIYKLVTHIESKKLFPRHTISKEILTFIAPYLDEKNQEKTLKFIENNKNNAVQNGYYANILDVARIIKNPNYALLVAIIEKDSESIEYLARSNHNGKFHLTPEIIKEVEKIIQDKNSPEKLLQSLSLFNPRQKSAMQVIEYKDEPPEELSKKFIEQLPGDSLDIIPQLQ